MRTRFAPSPTGYLHLGHAYSALLIWARATAAGGQALLRIEDIDTARSTAAFETAITEDLHWLGLDWPLPVMRQSTRLPAYSAALDHLARAGLTYPCRCTRSDIRAALTAPQEGASGPDGPAYPGTCRARPMSDAAPSDAIRLNMARATQTLTAQLSFTETGPLHAGRHQLAPDDLVQNTGDIILARRDIGTSYHLAVVVDDTAQQISEVIRGTDLITATPLHRLLQALLGLPTPAYHHHRLIRDDSGKRLAKRDDARALRHFRARGATPQDIRQMLGL